MVMSIAFHPDYEELKTRLEALKSQYTERLAYYSHETSHVRHNLETQYMMTIGRKEFKVFSSKVELSRLKREIALYQQAVNTGVKITQEAVEAVLQREFADYMEQMEKKQQAVREAEESFLAPKLSAEEMEKCTSPYLSMSALVAEGKVVSTAPGRGSS